jgi:hypothetical protein
VRTNSSAERLNTPCRESQAGTYRRAAISPVSRKSLDAPTGDARPRGHLRLAARFASGRPCESYRAGSCSPSPDCRVPVNARQSLEITSRLREFISGSITIQQSRIGSSGAHMAVRPIGAICRRQTSEVRHGLDQHTTTSKKALFHERPSRDSDGATGRTSVRIPGAVPLGQRAAPD